MENNNEIQQTTRSGTGVQYSEGHGTGLLGVFIFFVVMLAVMLIIAHFFG